MGVVHLPIGTCASGVTGNSFTIRLGGTPALEKWPSICLVVFFKGLSDAATWTAWYSDWSSRTVLMFAVTWQFSSYTKRSVVRLVHGMIVEHTWRTVTGNLTPWLSHITVIPRLRAMRPVRTDVGVQVLVDADKDSASAVALLTTVEWNALHRGKTGRVPNDQSLSMMRSRGS